MSEAAGASEPTTLQFDAATLSSVARLASMGIWRMDCTSPLQTLLWDDMSHHLHGTDRERFQPTLGGSLLLYEDESRSRLEDALMACSVNHTPFEVEVDRRLDNGQTRRLLVAGTAQAGGREILGYYQDVSQRKQLVNRLQLEQSQTRALFRTLPDLMFAVDAGGFFRQYYTGQSPLLKHPPESYVGRHISEAFPYLRQEFPPKLRHACDSGEITTLEFQLHTNDRDGTFELRILPLEKGGDHVPKALLLIRDITEQHRRSEELKRSQEAALLASRVKSQFLANMSHEIRTPLNGVIGMTELLLGTDLQNEQREYAQTALRSAQSLLETVNDILDLSKIEANRLDLETIPFSLRAVVQDAIASIALKAHEKGLELVGSVAPSVPSRVVGDPTRIRQLLNNLLSNAIKFTSQGEVELQLAQREPGIIRVSVFDTGEGIAYERQREIFDPFTQADGSTTRRFGGTGLGLTICRQLVEKMGGRIWLESQPGQGSRFSFTVKLPNYHTEMPEADAPYHAFVRDLDQPDLSAEDFANYIQGKRVLIIDDNASCRRVLKEMLANWGIEAQVAVGPGPAMQMVREAQRRGKAFDLALVDFQMPGCDGLELAQELPTPLTSVLMVTLGRPLHQQLNQTGVKKVAIKPLLSQELARLLLGLFRQQPPPSAFPAQPVQRAGEPLKILIAEDNLVNAKVVSKMLQRLGHEVVHVVNGELAVDYLQQNQVDVVLMDVQMPVMDGFEATRRWRAIEATRSYRVPIVALTGNAMSTDREMCLEAGMDLHLTKPIRLDLLDQMLNSLPPSR
ncbi:MAG: response regulator [Candidatus Eremiobacteraeota bacterium]|nr:response regulator [Candidatus Eremiobacteraeota bacterium]MCW5868362.1 response regulator [Candidatus Eremiobacteraeota bacterium]